MMACEICRLHCHAKWHDYCRGEINPVALVGWAERALDRANAKKLVDYIEISTGMDMPKMRAAVADLMKQIEELEPTPAPTPEKP